MGNLLTRGFGLKTRGDSENRNIWATNSIDVGTGSGRPTHRGQETEVKKLVPVVVGGKIPVLCFILPCVYDQVRLRRWKSGRGEAICVSHPYLFAMSVRSQRNDSLFQVM